MFTIDAQYFPGPWSGVVTLQGARFEVTLDAEGKAVITSLLAAISYGGIAAGYGTAVERVEPERFVKLAESMIDLAVARVNAIAKAAAELAAAEHASKYHTCQEGGAAGCLACRAAAKKAPTPS